MTLLGKLVQCEQKGWDRRGRLVHSDHLYLNGKLWRSLNNVYKGVSGMSGLMVNPLRSLWLRRVRQGLVLLPPVFLLGMDPLFRQLEGSGLDQ